jgi:DNA-binding NarL/FixJ family response regulator
MGSMASSSPRPEQARVGVMVVHASDASRAGLEAVLGRAPDIHVLAMFRSAEDAMRSAASGTAGVCVLDLALPGIRGWVACAEIVRSMKTSGVIVLAPIDDTLIRLCLRVGARGYLARDASAAEVTDAVRAVARGEAALAPQVVERMIDWARTGPAVGVGGESLKPSEIEAVSLVGQGLRTRQVAERMRVSEASVKLYLRSAMRKLGVHERSSAVAECIKRGVIS